MNNIQNNVLIEVIKQTTNPILITNSDVHDLKIIYINNAFTKMTDYCLDDLIGKTPNILRGKDSSVTHLVNFKTHMKEGQSFSFTTINYKKDGSKYDVKINIFPIKDDQKNIINYAAIQEDISNHVKEINYLQKFINLQDSIIILIKNNDINFANQRLFDFFDFKDLEHFKKHHNGISELFIEDERFFNLTKIKNDDNWVSIIRNLPHSERIVAMLGHDFKIHAFSITVNTFDEDFEIVTFSNISQTVLNQIRLQEKTVHDKLTCAFNREYFEQNYKYFIEDSIKDKCLFGLAILDIDHFKKVNDTYGHDIGDYVLINMVQVINKNSRENDILIRWGGEEFIMIFNIDTKDELHSTLENIRKVIEMEDFDTVGTITCSFGATVYHHTEDIELTIKRADDSLYYSKRTGRNKITIE